MDWVNRTFASAIEDIDHFVVFVNNVTAQETDAFKKSVADHQDLAWYGLANATDLWQVIDAGIAQTLKVLTGHKYQGWWDRGERRIVVVWAREMSVCNAKTNLNHPIGWESMGKAVWTR